jgi:hypothetical protein
MQTSLEEASVQLIHARKKVYQFAHLPVALKLPQCRTVRPLMPFQVNIQALFETFEAQLPAQWAMLGKLVSQRNTHLNWNIKTFLEERRKWDGLYTAETASLCRLDALLSQLGTPIETPHTVAVGLPTDVCLLKAAVTCTKKTNARIQRIVGVIEKEMQCLTNTYRVLQRELPQKIQQTKEQIQQNLQKIVEYRDHCRRVCSAPPLPQPENRIFEKYYLQQFKDTTFVIQRQREHFKVFRTDLAVLDRVRYDVTPYHQDLRRLERDAALFQYPFFPSVGGIVAVDGKGYLLTHHVEKMRFSNGENGEMDLRDVDLARQLIAAFVGMNKEVRAFTLDDLFVRRPHMLIIVPKAERPREHPVRAFGALMYTLWTGRPFDGTIPSHLPPFLRRCLPEPTIPLRDLLLEPFFLNHQTRTMHLQRENQQVSYNPDHLRDLVLQRARRHTRRDWDRTSIVLPRNNLVPILFHAFIGLRLNDEDFPYKLDLVYEQNEENEGEAGVGAGVTKDIYHCFFEQLQLHDGFLETGPSGGVMPSTLRRCNACNKPKCIYATEAFYRAFGNIIAKCLHDNMAVDLHMSIMFTRFLLETDLQVSDVDDFDVEYGIMLNRIRNVQDIRTFELERDHVKVTDAGKEDYIHEKMTFEWFTERMHALLPIREGIRHFNILSPIFELLPLHCVHAVIFGKQEYSAQELRQLCVWKDTVPLQHPICDIFDACLGRFSAMQRSTFVYWCTGSITVPRGTTLSLQLLSSPDAYPVSQSCFLTVSLPPMDAFSPENVETLFQKFCLAFTDTRFLRR